MYPRHSPAWVLGNHLEDQLPNLLRRPSSSNLRPDSGDQPPTTYENQSGANGLRFQA